VLSGTNSFDSPVYSSYTVWCVRQYLKSTELTLHTSTFKKPKIDIITDRRSVLIAPVPVHTLKF
jgi:hypothetical protein